VLLTGEARLMQFLEEACQPGRAKPTLPVGAAVRCLPDSRLQDKFEETAVTYAVTFEGLAPDFLLGASVASVCRVEPEESEL